MDAQTCYRCFHPLHGAAPCPHCGYNNDSYRAEPHFLPPGTLLRGRYMLGAALGEGGFGITYAGFDTSLDRRVAVKEFFPQGSVWREAEKSTAVSSFTSQAQQTVFQNGKLKSLQEAKSLAKLDDVGAIVRVLDFFEENNTAYIIMEYVEGVTLKAYVRRLSGPMPAREAVSLLLPVMRALEVMHKRGFVHRDISPDNIMIPPQGEAKLLDFGAVKAVTDAAGNATEHPVVKRGFSPLELYSSEGLIGPWSDVYAMCATIYYLITGQILQEPMNRINNDGATVTALAGTTEPLLRDALLRGLTVQPAGRTQSMTELRAALESAISQKKGESYTVPLELPIENTISLPNDSFQPPVPDATQTAIETPVRHFTGEESITRPMDHDSADTRPKPSGGFWSTPRVRLVWLGAAGVVVLAVLAIIIGVTSKKNASPAVEKDRLIREDPGENEDGAAAANPLLETTRKTGDLVEFGSYPQTRVTDKDTVAALDGETKNWKSYGYYSGTGTEYDGAMQAGDFMRYADVSYKGNKYRAVTFDTYRPWKIHLTSSADPICSFQDSNGYDCGKVYYFLYEPLVWRVLDPVDGLVLSEYLIDAQPFQNIVYKENDEYYQSRDKSVFASNYEKSTLRQWLLNDFCNTAFSAAEQALITETEVESETEFQFLEENYCCKTTVDKLFLLSTSDVKTLVYGFSDDDNIDGHESRQAYGTDYAKCQGLLSAENIPGENAGWWLRAPSYSSEMVRVVTEEGGIPNGQIILNDGVRPAFRFKMD